MPCEAHDLSPWGTWRKARCFQKVKSCQISTGKPVLINIVFVRKVEEMASLESGRFQSLVPRKEASITVLMLEEDVFNVSGPERRRWSGQGPRRMRQIVALVVGVTPSVGAQHSAVYKALLYL